jgi:hypothetical protein
MSLDEAQRVTLLKLVKSGDMTVQEALAHVSCRLQSSFPTFFFLEGKPLTFSCIPRFARRSWSTVTEATAV